MELVYLWVKNYKNIHEQGFNFSPKFECSYDKGSNKLTIDPKEHIENFFGEKINVTAIVGENGSGKTSVIESLLNKEQTRIIIYNKDDVYYIKDNYSLVKNKDEISTIKLNTDNSKQTFLEEYVIYINNDILKTANILDTRSMLNSHTYDSNEYIKNLKSHDDSYKYDLKEFQKKILPLLFTIPSNSLFNFVPESIIVSTGKGEISDNNELKTYIENSKGHINNKLLMSAFNENFFTDKEELFFEACNKNVINLNIYDKLGRNIFHLSSGERRILFDFLLLNDALKNKSSNDVLVCLDEPDITLHPDWQRNYINELTNTFSEIGKNIHFIITSHSPFILSDLPKENVIFLNKYTDDDEDVKSGLQKVGNCKNATKITTIDTFGANIHTLLSHGFFIKGGLMGEFAKNKINEVIDNLQNKKVSLSQKQIKSIISTIGEPFLQTKLGQMYNNKFEIDDELEELQKEQDKINLRIAELKKQKSADAKS